MVRLTLTFEITLEIRQERFKKIQKVAIFLTEIDTANVYANVIANDM